MDDEHKSDEPTEATVEGSAPVEPVTPGPPAFMAAPGSAYAGAGGWTWAPPPPPPGPPGTVGGGAQWVGPPGSYWAVSPTPQPKRLQVPTALLVVALLVIGGAAGFGIGRVAWQSRSTSASQPSASSPSSGLPFGSGSLPFGSGSFPFGSGSSGSISTAPGGPPDPSAIAARVDPGVVDVNTTLSYYSEEAAGTGIVRRDRSLTLCIMRYKIVQFSAPAQQCYGPLRPWFEQAPHDPI